MAQRTLDELRSMPMGFYVDETSISYNAYAIAETVRDEYGVRYPPLYA